MRDVVENAAHPTVSIVVATYNSSHLLRYALESIRCQTFSDWETIVVGDCCTDDSENVVASLDDRRIRFLNLDQNSGQQATPNNTGVSLARGRFLAFLNHDDLFLPDHLSTNLDRMAKESTELLLCPFAEIPPEQIEAIAARRVLARVGGYAPKRRYSPNHFHVASSWFMRREVSDRVGPWRTENETYVTPSQDWLFRASRKGIEIRCTKRPTLVVIPCGFRKDSYRKRESREHEFIYRETIASDRLRGDLLGAVTKSQNGGVALPTSGNERRMPRWIRKMRRAFDRLLVRCGIHPQTPRLILRHGGRGGLIRSIKRLTG